jgi:hypothetical protein
MILWTRGNEWLVLGVGWIGGGRSKKAEFLIGRV